MNPKTSQSSVPITFDDKSSTSHPVVGESLPSSFLYILIGPVDTNLTISSLLSMAMSSSAPPPFTYLVSCTSGPSSPSTSGVSTGPLSSSLRGSSTMFHFGMGSSAVIGS